MRSPAANYDSPDWRFAHHAGLAGSHVDAVLELEEAFYTIGVYVVRDGGAS